MVRKKVRISPLAALILLVASASLAGSLQAAPNVTLWDTGSPWADATSQPSRTSWKAVPSDLLMLEADPPKASSDPGYYGREYSFKGDAVVESQHLAAVFSATNGRVLLYQKTASVSGDNTPQSKGYLGRKIVEVFPRQANTRVDAIRHLAIVRNNGDEVVLKASFSKAGLPDSTGYFAFDKTGLVDIKPAENMSGVSLVTAFEYGVVPGFIGDDLIFGAADSAAAARLHLPAEQVFLGLLPGEDAELVMAWPPGRQQLQLQVGPEQTGPQLFQSIEFDTDGKSLYLEVLGAPGLWHQEALTSAYLEKDKPSSWKRPFPARWKTQLFEEGLKTTFAFRESKGQIWRGVPGSYNYPVWFQDDTAFYHLSKKVPPKGKSVIYCLEGQGTPASVTTPVDMMKAALGRSVCDPILDLAGRKLRTHHRRGGDGVRRACTCGCTEAIQAIFEAGEETARKEAIQGDLDDMIFFVQCHLERIDEYRRFADALIQFLQTKAAASPGLKPYLENLSEVARQIPQECELQKENMKSLEHAQELTRQTMALTQRKDANNLKAYMELLKAWRDMGGAQDYVVARCHMVARRIAQEAGYGCIDRPGAAALAEEIRTRCRQCLRNPDGYEIWADY